MNIILQITNENAETGICSVIAELAIGDSVRVTGSSSDPARIQTPYSGFNGHIMSDNLTSYN